MNKRTLNKIKNTIDYCIDFNTLHIRFTIEQLFGVENNLDNIGIVQSWIYENCNVKGTLTDYDDEIQKLYEQKAKLDKQIDDLVDAKCSLYREQEEIELKKDSFIFAVLPHQMKIDVIKNTIEHKFNVKSMDDNYDTIFKHVCNKLNINDPR